MHHIARASPHYALKAWGEPANAPCVDVAVMLQQQVLYCSFFVAHAAQTPTTGLPTQVEWPAHTLAPWQGNATVCRTAIPEARTHQLWQHTCFEVFIQPDASQPAYIEINAAPTGQWNEYVFSAYREPPTHPPPLHHPPCLHALYYDHTPQHYVCTLAIACHAFNLSTLRLGLTAVIQPVAKAATPLFYARQHPSTQADFHHALGWLSLAQWE